MRQLNIRRLNENTVDVDLLEVADMLGVDVDPAQDPAGFVSALKEQLKALLSQLDGGAAAPSAAPPDDGGQGEGPFDAPQGLAAARDAVRRGDTLAAAMGRFKAAQDAGRAAGEARTAQALREPAARTVKVIERERRLCAERGWSVDTFAATKARILAETRTPRTASMLAETKCDPETFAAEKAARELTKKGGAR